MKIKVLGENRTEMDLGNGIKVLFSYQTPVAYSKLTSVGTLRYKTNEYYSRTTSKHISQWYHEYDDICPQEEIDNLVK